MTRLSSPFKLKTPFLAMPGMSLNIVAEAPKLFRGSKSRSSSKWRGQGQGTATGGWGSVSMKPHIPQKIPKHRAKGCCKHPWGEAWSPGVPQRTPCTPQHLPVTRPIQQAHFSPALLLYFPLMLNYSHFPHLEPFCSIKAASLHTQPRWRGSTATPSSPP